MKGRVPAGNVKLKRAYESPAPEDGMRILVDRLWPRGTLEASRSYRSMDEGHLAEYQTPQVVWP